MNYLGHLYFSNNDTDCMYANLFGDFVKGKDLSKYAPSVQQGIRLHRTIDSYIDNHPAVRELLHKLYPSLPKVAGIAIDLYFDHLLAKKWEEYHTIPLEQFIDTFHSFEIDQSNYENDLFNMVIRKMKEEKWLYHYKTMYGLTKACEGLSTRISFENVLHTAPDVFNELEIEIEKAFDLFMADAIPYFQNYFTSIKS
jgi:acyl carrier protein phosphodiesterase